MRMGTIGVHRLDNSDSTCATTSLQALLDALRWREPYSPIQSARVCVCVCMFVSEKVCVCVCVCICACRRCSMLPDDVSHKNLYRACVCVCVFVCV